VRYHRGGPDPGHRTREEPVKRVLIADDHEVTRRGLRDILLDAFACVEVVEAADGAAALAKLATGPLDLIVLDVLMPGPNILDLIAAIRADRVHAKVPVLVLTAATEIEYCIQSVKAGANGVIHKHRVTGELLAAIEGVMAGGVYLHPETALAVAAALREDRQTLPHQKLSRRELEIFVQIALGRAIKEIAGDLGLSDKTVATYVSRIREKTGLSSYVDIARYAIQNKLVD